MTDSRRICYGLIFFDNGTTKNALISDDVHLTITNTFSIIGNKLANKGSLTHLLWYK